MTTTTTATTGTAYTITRACGHITTHNTDEHNPDNAAAYRAHYETSLCTACFRAQAQSQSNNELLSNNARAAWTFALDLTPPADHPHAR